MRWPKKVKAGLCGTWRSESFYLFLLTVSQLLQSHDALLSAATLQSRCLRVPARSVHVDVARIMLQFGRLGMQV